MSAETNIVLLLDLASENPIHEATICGRVPGGPSEKPRRLTDYGVERCAKGTPNDWRPVIAAIDEMVRDAREAERNGARCRYWVAGRAGLPAFFHLGHQLSRKARVTVLNHRDDGELDELRFDAVGSPGAAADSYFAAPTWPPRPKTDAVRLGLIVASRPVPPGQIEQLMSSRGEPVAWVVDVQAKASDIVDARSVVSAVRELDQAIADLQIWYPKCKELAVFLKGPATLACLAGRAISPHIFPDLQIFQHRNQEYEPAYEIRTSLSRKRHTVLLLAANPVDTGELELDEEERAIREALRGRYQARFDIQTRRAARPMDLLQELRRLGPTVVQFSGHGEIGGLFFQADDRTGRVVSRESIGQVFGAVAVPVEVVILNACYSDSLADELLAYTKCVVGMHGPIGDEAARRFTSGFYGGLVEGASIASAFEQGRVAIGLPGSAGPAPAATRDVDGGCAGRGPLPPTLRVRRGVDAGRLFLAEGSPP